MTELKVGRITFDASRSAGDVGCLRPYADAVWYLPERKEDALAFCKRLPDAEIEARGKSRDLHGLGFAINGIPHPTLKQPTGSLVYHPYQGLHGLRGADITALCDWAEIKPGLVGGYIKPEAMESPEWKERARICAKVEADAMAAKAKNDANRLMAEYGALAECANRYLELCEEFHKRGKIRKKAAKQIIGRQPLPDGEALAGAFRRLSGERSPVAADPEAAAGGAQAQVVRQVKAASKRKG